MSDVKIHVHISNDPYTRIRNSVLQDDRISFCARGVLAYLFSKPANWTPMMKDVQKNGGLSEYAQQKVMRELREAGYAWLEKTPTGQVYHVTDIPQNPPPEIRRVRNSTGGNSGGIQTKEGTNKRIIKKKESIDAGNELTVDKAENGMSEMSLDWDQDDFGQWWNAYPKQIGQDAARKAYFKAADKTDRATLLRGAEGYAAEVKGRDKQYIKGATAWLNEELWDDYDYQAKGLYRYEGQDINIDAETAARIGAKKVEK